jgi:error-prone DNA polymerase
MRMKLPKAALRRLAEVGALKSLSAHRRDALWRVEKPLAEDDLFSSVPSNEETPLAMMNPVERINADYRGTGVTIGPHPMALTAVLGLGRSRLSSPGE